MKLKKNKIHSIPSNLKDTLLDTNWHKYIEQKLQVQSFLTALIIIVLMITRDC